MRLTLHRAVAIAAALLPAGASASDIYSFDSSGRITFSGVTSAVSYQVVWATNPEVSGWSTAIPPASVRIPALVGAIQSATVDVSWLHCLYRVHAYLSNAPPAAYTGMVAIPAGSFAMGNPTNVFPLAEGNGNEVPLHTVTVSGFYLDRCPVTRALWDAVTNYNGGNGYSYSNPGSGRTTNHPVHSISWYDAVKWCNARSEMDGFAPVYYTDPAFSNVYRTGVVTNPYPLWSAGGYRLPTEAEWERAARGGVANHRFPWTSTDNIQHSRANYYSTNTFAYDTSPTRGFHPSYDTDPMPYTSPVGAFATNSYGLYDMAGNIRHWCWDWYLDTYYETSPSSNPRGPSSGTSRVLRGESWDDRAIALRCSARVWTQPDSATSIVGFRCARRL